MKFTTIVTIATSIFLFTSIASAEKCDNLVYNGKFPTTTEKVTIVCHKRYAVGYSQDLKTPLWVAEHLTKDQVANENAVRKDNFRPDPAIPFNKQPSIKAFIGTGYDKGHMANFENSSDDASAGDESFYMINMVPQAAKNNRGPWRSVEMRTRKIATNQTEAYIITGPIFEGKINYLIDGTPIPTRLFKVIYSPNTKKSYTIVMPNSNEVRTSTMALYFSNLRNLQILNPKVTVFPVQPQVDEQKLF